MTEIRINCAKPYDVFIGEGLHKESGEMIKKLKSPCKAAVITDDIVEKLYADTVISSLRQSGFDTVLYSFKNGEGSKNINTLSDVLEFLAQNGITRSDIIIALGGGVVGDLAGFASAVYLRGVSYVQMPTTLLAAVDSSVGGKTAIDLKNGKNLAGSFYPPIAVICDTLTLDTLQSQTLSDGVAEALKYGVLFDKELFDIIAEGEVLRDRESIIARCVDHKRQTVEQDEFDTGLRQLLNYGHTIGHAIEKCSGYTISHGRGVAIGMAAIAKAAQKMGICDGQVYTRTVEALKKYDLPFRTEFDAQQLYDASLRDKKRQSDYISIVMPSSIGECFLKKIPIEELANIITIGIE